MDIKMTPEDIRGVEYSLTYMIKVQNKLSEITVEFLNSIGIKSLTHLAEKSMQPCLIVKYLDETKVWFKGNEDIMKEIDSILEKFNSSKTN